MSDLERGRASYACRAWLDAHMALSKADRVQPLGVEDLERLAWSSELAGHERDALAAWERVHDAHAQAGDALAAARAAFWLGFHLLNSGEAGRGTGWLTRSRDSIERHGGDCVERGYLLVPAAREMLYRKNDPAAAQAAALEAVACGDRFGDRDLASLARMAQGQAEIALGREEAGIALLDQAMLPATGGHLTPFVTGVVYCAVIGCCQRIYALDRAREWTMALAAWCDAQPQLAAFNGACRVHRSEVLQFLGSWAEAIEEARLVAQSSAGTAPTDTASACYQQGEILRLRGDFAAAEEAYREASQHGRAPQPGLALLRLAQGKPEAAAAAIRQAVAATGNPLTRTRYLPAAVEILIAADDLGGAEEAARDLERIASHAGNPVLDAMAAHAVGALRLARDDASAAIEPLRSSFSVWQQVGAPYLAARIRVLLAKALEALGDDDGALLERDAARAVFRELGAASDLTAIGTSPREASANPCGLTSRELHVLRLLASGRTNRAISQELFLSEKTIDRHVSNIFMKIDVHTRAAATAFAYEHKLV